MSTNKRHSYMGPLERALVEIEGMYTPQQRARVASMCVSLYRETRAERTRRNRNSGDK